MTDSDDDRDRPTQPNSEAPVDVDHGFGQLPRLPRLPSIAPDRNSWEHRQLAILVEAVGEIKEARKAFDADALLSRQTEVFASIVTDRYEMIRGPLVEFGTKLDELAKTVTKHGLRLESGDDRFTRIELDMVAMRAQMDRLDRELAVLRGIQNATQATAPPKFEPAPGG
jgi:hypothetical protein